MTSHNQYSYLIALLTIAVAPGYLLLSLTAVLSRTVSFLDILASHGKTNKNPKQWWSIQVPKKFFSHFYVVGIGSFLALRSCALPDAAKGLSGTQITLLLHLARRLYECLRVHEFRSASRMHVAGYLLGIGHYLILPVVFLGRSAPRVDRLWICFLCYGWNIWMQYEQHIHHTILAGLRRGGKSGPASYCLPPNTRWFRWTLCPHYLAEILIYASWSVLLSQEQSLPVTELNWLGRLPLRVDQSLRLAAEQRHWFLLLWVSINLTVSSLNSRDWYRQRYPQRFTDQ